MIHSSMMQFLKRIAVVVALSVFVLGPATPSLFAQEDGAAATDHKSSDAEDHDHKDGDGHDHGDDKDQHADDDGHDHGEDGSAHGATAHGDGHDSHADLPPLLSIDVGSAVCNIAIFLGVFAILSKFVWPSILSGLKAREEKINSDLEGAEKANSEAQSLLTEYQAKLDDAASQVQTMLADARRDAEAAGQRIVEEAKAEAQRQSERALADIETAKKVALSDIAGQTSNMAINVAKQVVGRELKESDHADLIRQSLDRLPSNN